MDKWFSVTMAIANIFLDALFSGIQLASVSTLPTNIIEDAKLLLDKGTEATAVNIILYEMLLGIIGIL